MSDLQRVQIFVHLSGVNLPPFIEEDATQETHIVKVRSVEFSEAASLACVNKEFRDAWRLFVATYVLDHFCAIVRGTQTRYIINCILKSKTLYANLLQKHNSDMNAVLDECIEIAQRIGNLCPLPIMQRDPNCMFTERRCMAESMRMGYDVDGVDGPGRSQNTIAETTFLKQTNFYADPNIMTQRVQEKNVDQLRIQYYMPVLAAERLTLLDLDELGVGAALNDHYMWHAKLALRAPSSEHLAALADAFPDAFAGSMRPRQSQKMHAINVVYALTSIRSSLRNLYERALSLPLELFGFIMARTHVLECMNEYPMLGVEKLQAAMLATHGTREATQHTMAFVLFSMIAHTFYRPPKKRISVSTRGVAGGLISLQTLGRAHVERLQDKARNFNKLFGTKISDIGIMSTADVVLHAFDSLLYRDASVAWRGVTRTMTDRVNSVWRRDMKRTQALLMRNAYWNEFATQHQRLRELYSDFLREYQISYYVSYDESSRGTIALWKHMQNLCQSSEARAIQLLINNTDDVTLPPLVLQRVMPSANIKINVHSSSADGQPRTRREHASQLDMANGEYSVTTISDPNSRIRGATQAATENVARVNNRKTLCSFVRNTVGRNKFEFLLLFDDAAFDYDRPITRPSTLLGAHNTTDNYYYSLARDSVNAAHLYDASEFFVPLSLRITRMFGHLNSIDDDDELQAYIERICIGKGTCKSCRRTLLQPDLFQRGICTNCDNKKKRRTRDDDAAPQPRKQTRVHE